MNLQSELNNVTESNQFEDNIYNTSLNNTAPPSILLRNAREKNGMSVKATAKQLFLETGIIRVLESDKYDELPNVFVRGYLRNYAKLQEIPQETIMESFDTMIDQKPTLSPVKPKLKPYMLPYLKDRYNFNIDWSIFIIGILTIIILLKVIVWQFNSNIGNQSLSITNFTDVVENVVQSDIIIPNIMAAQTVNVTEIPINIKSTKDSKPDIISPIASDTTEISIPEKSDTNLSITTQNNHVTPLVLDNLRVEFTEKAWIRVSDKHQKKLYQGIGKNNDVLNLEGIPPFSIKVGNFAGVYIKYQNQAGNIRTFPKSTANNKTFIVK